MFRFRSLYKKYNDASCLICLRSWELHYNLCYQTILWQSSKLCLFTIDLTSIMNSTIRDIYLVLFWFFYMYDNFERIAWRLVSFLISDDFFSAVLSFYSFFNDRMRIDHAFLALMKIDLTRILWLIRLLAKNFVAQIARKIIKFDFAVFDDRFLCLTHLSFFWSTNRFFCLIFQIDRLWRNENRSKIKLIYFVDDSIAWLTWSISDFYD